jgi:hypothetical protein
MKKTKGIKNLPLGSQEGTHPQRLLLPPGARNVLGSVLKVLLLTLVLVAAPLWRVAPAMAAQIAAPEPQVASPALTISSLPESTCVLTGDTRTCELWAMPGLIQMPTGEAVSIWGFAESELGPALLPGPTLIALAGETLEVVLHNQVPGETMALLFPGQPGMIPDLDGVGFGETITYTMPADTPGTFLYEAGMTPNGIRQVAMGLYGALIVRPTAPGQAYDDPATAYDDEALLVLSELDPTFNLDPNGTMMTEWTPRYWLINGVPYPDAAEILTTAGNTILLRYVNAGLRIHTMGLMGLTQSVIAADGEAAPSSHRSLIEMIGTGQTLDTLVSVPASAQADALYALYDTNLLLHNSSYRAGPDEPVAFGGMLTFIRTVDGALPGDAGPTATVQIDPANTTGADGVTLNIQLDDTASGNMNVVAGEYFIDSLGPAGAGAALTIGAPAPVVQVNEFIPAATLDALESGSRIFYVRGMDAAANWGPVGSAVLNLDKEGPLSTGLSLLPNPTNGTRAVTLRATGDDRTKGRNNVVAGTYTLDGGVPEPLALNRTDAQLTAMTAELPGALLGALPEGQHPIEVTAQDSLGNWGVASIINLALDKTGPVAPIVTLEPAILDLSGAPPVTHVRVTAIITDALSSGVQSPLANAEGFLRNAGPNGTGFRLFPKDGLFDSAGETAYLDIPIASFLFLAQGQHDVLVHGLDAAGNWGALGTATLTIDRGTTDTVGPTITSLGITPNPTGGAQEVTLTAGASDPSLLSNIAAAEWFVGADPGQGQGLPLAATDGVFDSPAESLTALINVSGWQNGTHQVWVRARDAQANWGAAALVRLLVQGNNATQILADSFEAGLGLWSAAVGAISVTPEAALAPDGGVMGLQADLGGAGGLAAQSEGEAEPAYLSYLMPAGERGYAVQFYWDPNGSDLGAEPQDLLVGLNGGTPVFGIQVGAPGLADAYQLRGWALVDGVAQFTEWHDVADAPVKLGLNWRAAAAGWLFLSIDDTVVEELTALNTNAYVLHELWLGPSSVDPAASGSQYLDGFRAGRLMLVNLPALNR